MNSVVPVLLEHTDGRHFAQLLGRMSGAISSRSATISVNVVRGVYVVSRRSIDPLFKLVEPVSTPNAFRIASTAFKFSRPNSTETAASSSFLIHDVRSMCLSATYNGLSIAEVSLRAV
ncbi:uncharacterized protein LOC119642418 [Glossina fuscipes]|uniref:Uncharacterized protein LOC119642418 n=1 Tax=Glossina fuscipes TaxID=7396 RepID=A0A9C5ZF00_9MUSC|nr:uncharacterized protein LOC119642418 [Glossina fuscipes]